MRLSVLNGTTCYCDQCNGNINGTPSSVSPMNGTPSSVSPLNGWMPDSLTMSNVMNGMSSDDAQAYELAVLFGDYDAVNGLEDTIALNGWKEKRAARKEKRADKKQTRKDRRAHSPRKTNAAARRDERKNRRTRRQEKHDQKMAGEGGGGWGDMFKDAAGGLIDKLSGKALDAADALYDEGIDADPEVMYEMDQRGAFKSGNAGGGDSGGGGNTMMMLGLAALAFFALKGKK